MGGTGSGRSHCFGGKRTTEDQHRIDIRWLKKQGQLRPGTMSALSWSWGNKETGAIRYHVKKDQILLKYRHRPSGGDWEAVEQVICFDQTPCNYGGYRLWFLCPRCWKRIAVLYGADKYFFCRNCYDLAYSSQQECRVDRLMRKARKIRRLLGASDNLLEPILFKPKNMHQKTFDRLRWEADDASNSSLLVMGRRLGLPIRLKNQLQNEG